MADETRAIALGDIDRIRDRVSTVYGVYAYDRCATLAEHEETEAELAEVSAALDRLAYLEQDAASPPADAPRAIIQHFAAAMERKLAANDATKGGWRGSTTSALFSSLNDEVWELNQALAMWRQASETSEPTKSELAQDVLAECADVANLVMMISDEVGALPPTDERGR